MAIKYFAVLLPMLDPEKSRVYREQHLAFLDERRAEGKLFANGRFIDGWGGLVVYRAESLDEVTQLVQADPYIVHGARNYDIHEWELVKGKLE